MSIIFIFNFFAKRGLLSTGCRSRNKTASNMVFPNCFLKTDNTFTILIKNTLDSHDNINPKGRNTINIFSRFYQLSP